MSLAAELALLIDHIFLERDKAIALGRKKEFSLLLGKGVIQENENGLVISYSDKIICNEIITRLEIQLESSISQDIHEAISQINKFHEYLRTKYKHNYINAFDFILDEVKTFILLTLQDSESVDIIRFRESLPEDRPNDLFLFDKWFYSFLTKAKISPEKVLEVVEKDVGNENDFHSTRFIRELGNRNTSLAKELLKMTTSLGYPNPLIRSNLILGIHNSGKEDLFKLTVSLLKSENRVDFGTLARLELKNEVELRESFDLAGLESNEFWDDKAYLFCRIIENTKAPKLLKESCFHELHELLKISKEVADISMNVISLYLDKYEEEKFKLLITYIATTRNFNVVKRFFHEYKNPKYLFSLMVNYHKANGAMGVNRLFQEPIAHFWRSNRSETEKYLCDLFNPGYKLGLLPIEIILAHPGIAKEIDLLGLPEDFQLHAIDCINIAPHSFEQLLPVIINLQKSESEKVIDYLQENLKLLTTEAYGLLMEWLEENVDNKNHFLDPIKLYHEEYLKYVENKEKHDDLNPRENERELLELYYRLEHERQAKMMQKISDGENSFMSMMKSVTIVRGKSWKLENQEVRPLSHIEHSTWVDFRRIADPVSFEFRLKQFDKAS